MRKPRLGEGSLGAVVGAVIGAAGGLIAVAIPWAIVRGDMRALLDARTLGIIGFLVSSPVGWLVGGQIGPRLEGRLSERAAGVIGGIFGGLVPVIGFALWGWYLMMPK
jgi:hypothetical protein